mgnify:CR=1 FL=1|jgi:hypothetical protein
MNPEEKEKASLNKKRGSVSRVSIGLMVTCCLALASQVYLLLKGGGSSLRIYSVLALTIAVVACLYSGLGGNLQSKTAKIVFIGICVLFILSVLILQLMK